jgi:UDP-2,3-diacylglucosamine pyrophosphatase LpxH
VVNHYRTIFISDTHLGGACNYPALLNFLKENDADTWYVVGDFLGLWEVRRSKNWPPEANTVIQKILRKARKGAKFYFLPGNHDTELNFFKGFELGGIEVVEKIIFEALDGRKFLVIHGDIFDPVIGHAKWVAHIGSFLYDGLVGLNSSLNWLRKLLGMKFWSFSAAIKKAVKGAVSYVGDFEDSLLELARQEGASGVICGHIHTPCMREHDGVFYFNCGDWVESLTAIVEHHDGKFELIHHDNH